MCKSMDATVLLVAIGLLERVFAHFLQFVVGQVILVWAGHDSYGYQPYSSSPVGYPAEEVCGRDEDYLA